jgi:uncharacterized membrane protein YsdA (DUF1294 family)
MAGWHRTASLYDAQVIDPRNRPALIGSLVAGAAVFVLLWVLGLSPLVAWLVGWTLPAFAMYGIDKRQARSAGWRVPEAVLHGLALVGGVMGAWAGRAVFHHKTSKPVFTVVLIVASILWAAIVIWALLR